MDDRGTLDGWVLGICTFVNASYKYFRILYAYFSVFSSLLKIFLIVEDTTEELTYKVLTSSILYLHVRSLFAPSYSFFFSKTVGAGYIFSISN